MSILISGSVLFSGMRVTVATHLCRGDIAAVVISFSGKKASCGMESDVKNSNSSETGFSKHCCDDIIAVYKADITYAPTEDHFSRTPINDSLPFLAYHLPSQPSGNILNYFHSDIRPPGNFLSSEVTMSEICVFRI